MVKMLDVVEEKCSALGGKCNKIAGQNGYCAVCDSRHKRQNAYRKREKMKRNVELQSEVEQKREQNKIDLLDREINRMKKEETVQKLRIEHLKTMEFLEIEEKEVRKKKELKKKMSPKEKKIMLKKEQHIVDVTRACNDCRGRHNVDDCSKCEVCNSCGLLYEYSKL